jgi:hypothetical protein
MKKIFTMCLLALFCLVCVPGFAQKIEHGKRFRALILGMDGTKGVPLHESVFLRGEAPHIKFIMDHGQYTTCDSIQDPHCARTHLGHRLGADYFWVTSPGWATVLAGVNTDKHQVKENDFARQRVFTETSQRYPTLLSALKQKGFITAAGGVGNFVSSIGDDGGVSAGILDYECGENPLRQESSVKADAVTSCNADYRRSFNGDDEERDKQLAAWLMDLIQLPGEKSPDVIMGVFDTIDEAGHRHTFSSNPEYFKAIAAVDFEIAKIVALLKERSEKFNEEWLVIITADHGGHGRDHSDALLDDEVIPFVVATFGKQLRLEKLGAFTTEHITQMDVKPSVLHWFDVPVGETDGIVRSQYRWVI